MKRQTPEEQNQVGLALLDERIRSNVASVIRDLELAGYDAVIDRGVWRSPQEQELLFAKGATKVKWGYHCNTKPDGTPASLAADIVPQKRGWDAPQDYWLRLGAAAAKHGLTWGGLWFPTKRASIQAAELKCVLAEQRWDSPIALGWDPAHVQISGVKLEDVELQWRNNRTAYLALVSPAAVSPAASLSPTSAPELALLPRTQK